MLDTSNTILWGFKSEVDSGSRVIGFINGISPLNQNLRDGGEVLS
jgi:hypothetical protein